MPATPASPPAPTANKTAILLIILLSYVMIILDTSVVLTGLPTIHRQLSFSDTGLAWVQSAYTLAFGGFLLLGARAGDILGRRRMLIIGLLVFTVASLAIGMAQSPAWMIASRAMQGLGAAILAPSTLALLQTTFTEGQERTRAVSYYAAVAGIAASVGLVLGGVLAEWVSWRVGFFINLPIGVAMMLAARRYIVESPLRNDGQLDIAGALCSTIGMSALVFGFIRSARSGLGDPLTLSALLCAALLLSVFVRIEARAAQPIMPLRLFTSPVRATAYGVRMLFLGGMIGFFFFITLYLQQLLHIGPAMTGLGFLPMTLINFPVALLSPRLQRRFGAGPVLAAGLACCAVGMAWLSRIGIDSDYFTAVALPMVLIGIGQGFALSPMTALGISGVAAADAGAASGVVNVAHQMGSSIGLAILISVAALHAGDLNGPALLAHRVTVALTTSAGMLSLALLLVLMVIVLPRRR